MNFIKEENLESSLLRKGLVSGLLMSTLTLTLLTTSSVIGEESKVYAKSNGTDENILMRVDTKNGTFIAPDDFSEVIDNGKAFIDPGVKMGEGWLLTGEVVSLIKSGVTNVISAQPFGCLPNHIVAKGMVRKIKDEYPKANIVAIDYDPSASKVNQENRIRLMLANAKLSEEMKASI